MSFTDTFQGFLILGLMGILIMWWVDFYLVFSRSNNVGRASFMTASFLCLICEMGRAIDPFARRGIWSNETLRVYITFEVWIILTLLLLASDISAWLNYESVPGLLLKPRGRYRLLLYIGIFLMFIQTMVLILINFVNTKNSRGITIGWLLSALVMISIGLIAMLISLREVSKTVYLRRNVDAEVRDTIFNLDESTPEYHEKRKQKHRSRYLGCIRSCLSCSFLFDWEEYDEKEGGWKRTKYKKKSWRLAKYMICLACLFIFDIFFGAKPRPGEMDLLHLVYELTLKVMLGFMIFQRRPITEARGYEKDIHSGYHPFIRSINKMTFYHLNRSVTVEKSKKESGNYKGNEPLRGTSKQEAYNRVSSYQDSKNISNTALQGLELTRMQEVGRPDRPVKPPKEVPLVGSLPTGRLTLPSIGQAADAKDSYKKASKDEGEVQASAMNIRSKQSKVSKVRGGTNKEHPPSNAAILGAPECGPAAELSVEILENNKPRKAMEPVQDEKTLPNHIPSHSVDENSSDEVGIHTDDLKELVQNGECEDPSIELMNESPVVLGTQNITENSVELVEQSG